ncbi:MAG: hypothetical protein RMK20_14905, partial [Verrucomicrobiales bacterium]|nr:hypothetical protein [Verrucomicrobiales bacterium]
GISRRCFLKSTTAGAVTFGLWSTLLERLIAATPQPPLGPGSKVRIGKIYPGHERPGWPAARVDLAAVIQRYETDLAKLAPQLRDVEFVDAGRPADATQLAQARDKFRDVDGILVMHLTLGVGRQLESLMELGIPIVLFSLPYTGHEWHTIASWQRQGKLIEVYPTSRFEDVLIAIRPFRALRRLREARILHVNFGPADAAYCDAVRKKFGTEILNLGLPDLQRAYETADQSEAMADCRRWIREADRVVEPTQEEILKASRMFVAMRNLLAEHRAVLITMNCLGMGLMDRGMAYPCLGFVRLNNMGLGGVCEADLKSSLTHLIFSYLVGRPGFVTDPVIDLATSTIIHAHCVAATQMEGPDGPRARYILRSHLEDDRGASLQVRLPVGRKLTMARLIGTDIMLLATGDAVDSPLHEWGCRTKLTMKVQNIEKFLDNWSSGLHRVVFYGDHSRDVRRFCRFARIRVLEEGVDDLHQVEGLEWRPHVHA